MSITVFLSLVFVGLLISFLCLNRLWKFIYEDLLTLQLYDSYGALEDEDDPGLRFSSLKVDCIWIASAAVLSFLVSIIRSVVVLKYLSIMVPVILTLFSVVKSCSHYDRVVRRCCYSGISKKEDFPSSFALHMFNMPFSVPAVYGVMISVLSWINIKGGTP